MGLNVNIFLCKSQGLLISGFNLDPGSTVKFAVVILDQNQYDLSVPSNLLTCAD